MNELIVMSGSDTHTHTYTHLHTPTHTHTHTHSSPRQTTSFNKNTNTLLTQHFVLAQPQNSYSLLLLRNAVFLESHSSRTDSPRL